MSTEVTIAYHLGAAHTDEDQITWSLRKDSPLLAERGVLLRRPGEYRKLIKGMRHKLEGRAANEEEQENLLAAIIKNQDINRLVLSDDTMLGITSWVLGGGKFYRNAGRNTSEFRDLFPRNPVEFFLSIRNPATFLPEAFKCQTEKTVGEFFNKIDLHSIRWSEVISDILTANPGTPLTVWCNEDTPIIWPTVLAKVAGLEPQTRFQGELDIIRGIMSEGGIERLEAFLDSRPHFNEMQRRRVRGIVLEKYADSDAIETEINLPGWTDELIEEMTEIYEDDIDEIIGMPGVEFIEL